MKVVFVGDENEKYIKGALFYGKTYDALDGFNVYDFYYVVNISRNNIIRGVYYEKKYFITLKESRKIKIKRINDNPNS